MAIDNPPLKPGLYVTATPIGNLGDITFRAIETMKAADAILCEDTRVTATLCKAYNISTQRRPYQDHNAAQVRPAIIEQLVGGAAICLVSDAGTPLISDPGYKLVREAREAGVEVFPLPGPCAAIAALCAAGAPSDKFLFAGFPASKSTARKRGFEGLKDIPATLIFYESGHRLGQTLGDMQDVFGDRQACVAREITKLYEEFTAESLSALASQYAQKKPKGEIVILVWPPEITDVAPEDIDAFLAEALKTLRTADAADAAAESLGVKRRDAYARALALKPTQQ